jgi:hypothetical protein
MTGCFQEKSLQRQGALCKFRGIHRGGTPWIKRFHNWSVSWRSSAARKAVPGTEADVDSPGPSWLRNATRSSTPEDGSLTVGTNWRPAIPDRVPSAHRRGAGPITMQDFITAIHEDDPANPVFGDSFTTDKEVLANWEEIKKGKGHRTGSPSLKACRRSSPAPRPPNPGTGSTSGFRLEPFERGAAEAR